MNSTVNDIYDPLTKTGVFFAYLPMGNKLDKASHKIHCRILIVVFPFFLFTGNRFIAIHIYRQQTEDGKRLINRCNSNFKKEKKKERKVNIRFYFKPFRFL